MPEQETSERLRQLRSGLITGIEHLQYRADEKKIQRRGTKLLFDDAFRRESFTREVSEEKQRVIESFGEEGICPTCHHEANGQLEKLKAECANVEAEYSKLHDETELLRERLFDIDIEINELETQAHKAIINNRKIESEIESLKEPL